MQAYNIVDKFSPLMLRLYSERVATTAYKVKRIISRAIVTCYVTC